MRIWPLMLVISLLPGCGFMAWDCPPGEDCNFRLPPDFIGAWEAESPAAFMGRFVVGGAVNAYYADAWQNCGAPECAWGRAPVNGTLHNDDFPNDPKFNPDAVTVDWSERTPRVIHELWMLADQRALLRTIIADDQGNFDFEHPDHEDVMLWTSR